MRRPHPIKRARWLPEHFLRRDRKVAKKKAAKKAKKPAKKKGKKK